MAETSYTIDLTLEDNTRDAIKKVRSQLAGLKGAVDQKAVEESVKGVIGTLGDIAKDTTLDIKTISDAIEKESSKALKILVEQGDEQRKVLSDAQAKYDEIQATIDEIKRTRPFEEAKDDIAKLEAEQKALNIKEKKEAVEKNRQMRYEIKTASQNYKIQAINARIEAAQNKWREGSIKKRLKYLFTERKENNAIIKQLKEELKTLQGQENAQKALTGEIRRTEREKEKGRKNDKKDAKKEKSKDSALAKMHFATSIAGSISGGISSVTGIAERNLDRERQADRVKGFSKKEAVEILGDMYIKTGADYSSIVDAINTVQTTLKDASKEDIKSAAEIELRYPGASLAFASSSTGADAKNFNVYANRLKSLQKATGASDEQLQASTQMMANLRPSRLGNHSVTDLQGIYLGLQNSGAFETQDELDVAFRRFTREIASSKESAADLAAKYDWTKGIYNQRNRLQAENTIKNMDWGAIGEASNVTNDDKIAKTEAESLVENMRLVEEQKNKLLMTLVPAALPLVEELSKVLKGDTPKTIAEGLKAFFDTVIPLVTKVLRFLNDKVLSVLKDVLDWVKGKFFNGGGVDATQQEANGGVVFGRAIVGERAFSPEMILPLNYSRGARASNIIENISQTFNMSGNETTALSLSQAVKTRDFRRASAQSNYISNRGGIW